MFLYVQRLGEWDNCTAASVILHIILYYWYRYWCVDGQFQVWLLKWEIVTIEYFVEFIGIISRGNVQKYLKYKNQCVKKNETVIKHADETSNCPAQKFQAMECILQC